MKLLIACLLIFLSFPLFSCSCSQPSIELPIPSWIQDETETNEILFYGKLDKISVDKLDTTKLIYIYSIIQNFRTTNLVEIEIRTSNSSDACGYYDEVGRESIITALKVKGEYHTYKEECIRNVSKFRNPVKFDRWLKFLTTLSGESNGKYVFYQPERVGRKYFGIDYKENENKTNVIAVRFSIVNGNLQGRYELYNIDGDIIEKGYFNKGKKNGLWKIFDHGISDDYEYVFSGLTKIKYRKGVKIKYIEKKQFHRLKY